MALKLLAKSLIQKMIIIGFILTACFGVSIALIYKLKIPHQLIRQIVEKEMSKAMFREVKIDCIDGNLFSSAILKNVRIADGKTLKSGTIIQIPTLTAHYRLYQLIQKRGDIVATIYRLEAHSATIHTIRSTKDEWNILSLLLPPPNIVPPPLTFRGKIIFSNTTITFKDELGWGNQRLKTPYTAIMTHIQGQINFKHIKKTTLMAQGTINNSTQPFRVNGILNPDKAQYQIQFHTPKLDLTQWGNYVLARDGFDLANNTVAVSGNIVSKPTFKTTEIPFLYNLDVTLKNNRLKTPFLIAPINLLHGNVKIQDDQVVFKNIVGKIKGITATGNGKMYLRHNSIDLTIHTAPFGIDQLQTLFPALSPWQLTGISSAAMQIQGTMDHPVIHGNFDCPKTAVSKIPLSAVQGDFTLANQQLDIRILQSRCYQGAVTGNGSIDFSKPIPQIHGTLTGIKLQATEIFPSLNQQIKGALNLEVQVQGTTAETVATINVFPDQFTAFNQSINHIEAVAHITASQNIDLKSGLIILNHSPEPIYLTGNIQNMRSAIVTIKSKNIPLFDIEPRATENSTAEPLSGKGSINGTMAITLSPGFWEDPLSATEATLNIQLTNYVGYGQFLQKGSLQFSFNQNTLRLDHFQFENGDEQVFCQGEFYQFKPKNIVVKTINFNLSKSALIQKLTPISLKPFGGLCNLVLQIHHQEPAPFDTSLQSYTVAGEIIIQQAIIRNQPIQAIRLRPFWNGQLLLIQEGQIQQRVSLLDFSGQIDPNQNFKVKISEVPSHNRIDLSEFSILSSPYGTISGIGTVTGSLFGTLSTPNFTVNMSFQNARYNEFQFDSLVGKLSYLDYQLKANPLIFTKNQDPYTVSGSINLEPFLSQKPMASAPLTYQLDLSFDQAALNNMNEFINAINLEIQTRFRKRPQEVIETIRNANVQINSSNHQFWQKYTIQDPGFKNSTISLFNITNTNTNSLAFFERLETRKKNNIPIQNLRLNTLVQGNMSGKIHIQSNSKLLPTMQSDIHITNAQIPGLRAGDIRFICMQKDQSLGISLAITSGNIGGKDFDAITSTGKISSDFNFHILETNISANGRKNQNVLQGIIPLASIWDESITTSLALSIQLKDNDLGVLSLLNKSILDIQNEGLVALTITGSLKNPILNSQVIRLKNTKCFFSGDSFLKSPLIIPENTALSIENNRIQIPNLQINWQGIDTKSRTTNKEHLNQFQVSGNISIESLSFIDLDTIDLNMDLALKDTEFTVNLQNIYNGDITLKNATIKGIYAIPVSKTAKEKAMQTIGTSMEQGPVISANIQLANGSIAVPKLTLGAASQPKPSLMLNLQALISQDVMIEGSLLGDGFLAGLANTFTLKLTESSQSVKVSGSLNAPKIDNSLGLDSGEVNILNRTFTLLSVSDQKNYYKDRPDKIEKNVLSFTTQSIEGTPKYRLVPILNLKALTEVERDDTASTTTTTGNITTVSSTVKKIYKGIIIRFEGAIYELKSLYFDTYQLGNPQDKNREITPLKEYMLVGTAKGYNNQEILELLKLLMPDVLVTGETKQFINDLGPRQINLWAKNFLRPIEKNIAQRIGIIDDFQLEYNVGNQLLNSTSQALGIRNQQGNSYGKEERLLGINMIKNLSDQLVLKGVTKIDTKSQGPTKVTQLELTYYIFKNLSLNFSNEREYDDADLKPKISIKGSYEF